MTFKVFHYLYEPCNKHPAEIENNIFVAEATFGSEVIKYHSGIENYLIFRTVLRIFASKQFISAFLVRESYSGFFL